MLKIDFFKTSVINDYEKEIADEVRRRNGGREDIIFIPDCIINPKTKMPYKISIHDLLTLDRTHILEIDGIELYMYICSIQKYKAKNNVELLDSLSSEFKDEVKIIKHKKGCYKYEINKKPYYSKRKDNKKHHKIISEAALLIKNKISKYNTNYANTYFKKRIKTVDELNDVLKTMFDKLEKTLIKSSSGKPERIIDYSLISRDLRHKLMSSIGIRTCPYCNRNYITRYGINGSKSTADLDHFYQKEQYPLFALSLFNFVPSCPVCNSRMKNTHPADDAMYPYDEGFGDDVHFELRYIGSDPSGSKTLHLWQALESVTYDDFIIEIVIDPKTCPERRKRIEKSESIFHLTEVYEDHKQDALEIALRTRIYCEGSYKKFCEKLFDKCRDAGMVYSSASDLEKYMFREGFDNEWLMFGIFMNDEKRRFDRPLSRMIYDIYHSKDK